MPKAVVSGWRMPASGGRLNLAAPEIIAVTDVARRRGLRTHLDGARLVNGAVASGIPAREYAKAFDSAWIDFTKGLGAPVGAALAGSESSSRRRGASSSRWAGRCVKRGSSPPAEYSRCAIM